jgi:hypothetical protein
MGFNPSGKWIDWLGDMLLSFNMVSFNKIKCNMFLRQADIAVSASWAYFGLV